MPGRKAAGDLRQAAAFHGAVPVPTRLPSAFRPGIHNTSPSPINWKFNHNLFVRR